MQVNYKYSINSFFTVNLTYEFCSKNARRYLVYGKEFVNQRSTTFDAQYKFSGKERDLETNYGYHSNRYFSSDLGIWISVDPLACMSPELTPYNYCGNSPIVYNDPDGLFRTKFGAWLYKIFIGGGNIAYSEIRGEWYVSKDRNYYDSKGNVTCSSTVTFNWIKRGSSGSSSKVPHSGGGMIMYSDEGQGNERRVSTNPSNLSPSINIDVLLPGHGFIPVNFPSFLLPKYTNPSATNNDVEQTDAQQVADEKSTPPDMILHYDGERYIQVDNGKYFPDGTHRGHYQLGEKGTKLRRVSDRNPIYDTMP
ncbi:MAG: hypothetical protein LBV69_00080 [Bacteroidales bacterium]|jgi:RHS repeat-associated protein|nr:hypothetical protein [Bacteroidales bacterium]